MPFHSVTVTCRRRSALTAAAEWCVEVDRASRVAVANPAIGDKMLPRCNGGISLRMILVRRPEGETSVVLDLRAAMVTRPN